VELHSSLQLLAMGLLEQMAGRQVLVRLCHQLVVSAAAQGKELSPTTTAQARVALLVLALRLSIPSHKSHLGRVAEAALHYQLTQPLMELREVVSVLASKPLAGHSCQSLHSHLLLAQLVELQLLLDSLALIQQFLWLEQAAAALTLSLAALLAQLVWLHLAQEAQ
jgi:hypothetical protein